MLEAHIEKRTKWLKEHLMLALNSPTLTHVEMCKVKTVGLYLIYLEPIPGEIEFQYIGQTTRSNKRMRELASDFRSHTFNRKLLAERFRKMDIVIHVLSNKTKKDWMAKNVMTEDDFKGHQQWVNDAIRKTYKFKFYEYKHGDLLALEHFAIAVLDPLYND